jgi:DNA-binding transcriptional regulator YiaG
MKSHDDTELIDFDVQIPNLEGDGIAEVHTIKVPARKSTGGKWILTSEALERIEQTQARYMGLMTPGEIKELRRRIQYTQREMSELIQAGEKSYTRWETGKVRLSRLVNIILCAIRDGFLPLPYLKTLYEEGSDWYRKVMVHDALAAQAAQEEKPVQYKIIPQPALGRFDQPVVSTNCFFFQDWGAACKSNRLTLKLT